MFGYLFNAPAVLCEQLSNEFCSKFFCGKESVPAGFGIAYLNSNSLPVAFSVCAVARVPAVDV